MMSDFRMKTGVYDVEMMTDSRMETGVGDVEMNLMMEHTQSDTADEPDAVGADGTRSTRRRRQRRRSAQRSNPSQPTPEQEWVLQFDGACRGNPGPGGAGAALFGPDGAVVWTGFQYLTGQQTNNSAEYTGLLLGVRSAVAHGVRRLRIEGDSNLIISQVKGTHKCRNTRLRVLRKAVRSWLNRLQRYKIGHVDRLANKTADRLANRALDSRRSSKECGQHPSSTDAGCCDPAQSAVDDSAQPPSASPTPRHSFADMPRGAGDTTTDDEVTAAIARRDGGVVYPVLEPSYEVIPTRRARLRIRPLSEEEEESADDAVSNFASSMAAKLSEAEDWSSAEGYITAIAPMLYEVLKPYTIPQRQRPSSSTAPLRRRRRPPCRQSDKPHERGLDEALDDLEAVQRQHPQDRKVVQRARRKVGRIRSALARRDLRAEFRTNEKQCVHKIFESADPAQTVHAGPSRSQCPLTGDRLFSHFDGLNAPRSSFDPNAAIGERFRQALADLPQPTEARDALTSAISLDEIEDQLDHVAAGSAPGLDGVDYGILKRFHESLAPVLLAAYRACWRHQRVPSAWKVGAVRLLLKKGDPNDPCNWRPICLQQALYKVYAGILARRFKLWMEANARYTSSQKGFRSFNGCAEHNFVASSLADQARRKTRSAYLVWYDLQNAFGSIPHELLWFVMEQLGVPTWFIGVCKDLYHGAAFVVTNAADGTSPPIQLQVGVFQGCPLSPHLFTAALTPLLHALSKLPDVGIQLSENDRPSVTAYADDLKIFSSSKAGIQQQHDIVQRFLRWTGMRANPGKCRSLGVARNERGVLDSDSLRLHIHDDQIPAIKISEAYSYLGIGDGFSHELRCTELAPKLAQLKREATALFRSGLEPWQVLKAIKVYLYPRIDYALRHLRPLQSQLEGFDRHLLRGFRHMMRLPAGATTSFFYAPTSSGGLGLLPLTQVHGALRIAHAFQMLHSPDAQIQRIARAQLGQVVRTRHIVEETHWSGREEELLQSFLNGTLAASPYAPAKRRHGDVSSLWSDVQVQLRRFGLQLETSTPESTPPGRQPLAGAFQLRVPHSADLLDYKTILRNIKLHLKLQHRDRWAGLSDQGRTVRAQGGRGSSFIASPRGLWTADYLFAIQARLNQLDTNSVLKRKRLRAHATCRHRNCTRPETLAHILQHCPHSADAVTKRHDEILSRIVGELEARVLKSRGQLTLHVNTTVPGLRGPAFRPDIQLYDSSSRTAAIVDLAVPFETQGTEATATSSLTTTREQKIAKYDPIRQFLVNQGWKVHLDAVVYGGLGSVATTNQKTYTEALGLLKRVGRRLDLQLSSMAIQASRRIWKWHVADHRRDQHTRSRRVVEEAGRTSQRTEQRLQPAND